MGYLFLLIFIWQRIISTAESLPLPPTFLFLCKGIACTEASKICKSILLTQCVEIWSCGTGTIQMLLPPFCSITAFFWFYFLFLGKKSPWPPCSLCSTRFLLSGCINLLLPLPLTCTLFPWSLVSLQFACKNYVKLFFLLQAYFFFSFLRLSRKPFLNPFFLDSLTKKEREKMWEKKKMWKRWTEHGSGWWWIDDLTDVVS